MSQPAFVRRGGRALGMPDRVPDSPTLEGDDEEGRETREAT